MAVYAVLGLICFAGAVCYAFPSDKKSLRAPVPTKETLPYIAAELGATSYEESDEEADLLPAASRRRVQRKLVTGTEEIDGNQEYQEYQGVMGRPGIDFPILPSIPVTSFSCRNVKSSGYYADLETNCQVFHICDGGRKISFLCPNGTIFRQSHLICDWWFRVDCDRSVELYEESAEQLAADQRIYKERAEALAKAMQRGSNRARTSGQQHLDKKKSDNASVSQNNSQSRRHNSRKHSNNRYNTLNNDNNHNNNNNINNNQFITEKQESVDNQNHNRNSDRFSTSYHTQQSQRRQPGTSENRGRQSYNVESQEYKTFQQNVAPTSPGYTTNSNRQSKSQYNQNQESYESFNPESNDQYSFEQTSSKNNLQLLEQEKQLPAETASFASNRNNNFGNHFIQSGYYKTSTSKGIKLPVPNEFNRNTLPATVSTTESQFHYSTTQAPYNNGANNPQTPIFNAKIRPDKAFSYVELQQPSHSLHSSSTPSPTPNVALTPQVTFGITVPANSNANNIPVTNLGYTQAVSLNTFDSSYPAAPSFNGYSPNNQSDASFVTQNTPIYPSFNNSSSASVTKTSSDYFATSNQPSFNSVTPEYSYTSTTESPGYYYQNHYFTPNVSLPNSNSNQLTYPDTKLTSFPLSSPQNYISGVSTTLLPPDYNDITTFDNRIRNGTNQINSQYETTFTDSSQLGNRIGLKVPISSGPNALHSLALYYATSESDLSPGTTSLPPTKTTKLSISEILLTSHSESPETATETNILPSTDDTSFGLKDVSSVLTKATKDSYRYLFNETSEPEDNTQNVDAEVKLKSQDSNDLDSDHSSGIVQQTTTTETVINVNANETDYFLDDQKLKQSTDLRELAQVFSRALSAYLEDPESFRKVLSEVRPTEPTSKNTHAQSLAEESDEVLDYSDTGVSRVSPTTPTNCDDGDGAPVINIDEINNLVQPVKQNLTSDNYEALQSNENKDRLQTEEFFTTGNPTSLADVNYFFSNISQFISDINSFNINNSYFPTAGSVDDESRPRYGGFHNNSKSEFVANYAPYGSEIPENRTGQPFQETFPTETNTEFVTATEKKHINSGTITEDILPVTQSFIRLVSIADTLNAGDALDVNSLASSNNYSPKPATGHYVTSSDVFMKSTKAEPIPQSSTSPPYEYNTADDQEKVLIASSSQSLASRDNYVRFFTRKQNYGSKYQSYNINITSGKKGSKNSENMNSDITKISEPSVQISDTSNTYSNENTDKQLIKDEAKDTETLTNTDPGTVNIRFKTVQHIQPVDLSTKTIHELSNIKYHNHNYHNSGTATNDPQTVPHLSPEPQHISYQSVDLGNGVTIERRRTIPYNDTNSWLPSEVLSNGTTGNSFSLNNLLTSLNTGNTQSETTEYSVSTQTVQPTTYHPLNPTDDFDTAESIPPRGHQLRKWQWNVQKTTPAGISKTINGQDYNVEYKTAASEGAESVTKPYTNTLNSVTVLTTYAPYTSPETLSTAYVEQINPETIPTMYAELVSPETLSAVHGELLKPEEFGKILKPINTQSSSDTVDNEKPTSHSASTLSLYDSPSTSRGEQPKTENVSTIYNKQHAPVVRSSSSTPYAKQSHIDFSSVLQSPYAPFAENLSPAFKKQLPTTKLDNLTTIINKSDILEEEANEMFGGLNETSTNILMNMMNQAESNVTIRKLVLLLVADQSGRKNKTAEESRSQLIQALLQKPTNQTLPAKSIDESHTLVSPENIKPKKKGIPNTNTGTQTTNYTYSSIIKNKSNEHQSRGTKTYRDTEASTGIRTSIQQPQGTRQSSGIRNPKVSTLHTQTPDFSSESDSRAVELLKSLYNLAAKWG